MGDPGSGWRQAPPETNWGKVAAITGILALIPAFGLFSCGGSDKTSPAETGGAVSTSGAITPSTSGMVAGGSQPGENKPTFDGLMRIGETGILTDRDPPVVTKDGAFSTVRYEPNYKTLYFNDTIAYWQGSADPSYQDCVTALNQQGISSFRERGNVPVGDKVKVCVESNNSTSYMVIQPLEQAAVQARVVRWANVSA